VILGHRLDVVDICAKLFQKPSMHEKVTVRTRITLEQTDGQTDGRCDFNISPFEGIKYMNE
jgi:hypothetical protein